MKNESQLKKELMFIASNLPVVLESKVERHILTKEEAIIEFPETDPKTFAFIQRGPNAGKVVATMPVQLACNYYRRLKKAYSQSGEAGVISYIKKNTRVRKSKSGKLKFIICQCSEKNILWRLFNLMVTIGGRLRSLLRQAE